MSPGRFVASALALLVMAGCAGPRPAAHDDGGNSAALFGSDGEEGDGKGGIVGVVVDQAIRPVPNATVALQEDGNRTSAEDGSFSFVGLAPGAYLLTASLEGSETQETSVDVLAGQLTQVRIFLTPIPKPEPYNLTQPFTGFAQVTSAGDEGQLVEIVVQLLTGESGCDRCTFQFEGGPRLRALVIEATMAPNSLPSGSNGFGYYMERNGSLASAAFALPNPMTHVVDYPDMGGGSFVLTMYPSSEPVPEINKSFEVFVTLFYEQPPPEGFSTLDGS